MKAINTATRRIRNRRNCSFLTHGSDDYDHRSLNRARREESKAIIHSWTPETDTPVAPATKGETTFRVVVTSQVYENYGTHCCDCDSDESCTCEPYWKAKGGNEYQRNIGTASDVLAMGSKGVQAVADAIEAEITRNDRFFEEYAICWQLVPSTDETYEEQELREIHEEGWWPEEHADQIYADRLAALQI